MSVDAQTRILNHMNKDHRLAIEDYLCVYGDVAINSKIANIRMKDIELDHMTIEFNHHDIEFEMLKPIAFDPPLENFGQAREKLVAMAVEAAAKRGYSHIQIKDITYPTAPTDIVLMILIAILIVGYYSPSLIFQGLFPMLCIPDSVTQFLSSINNYTLYATIIAHVVELLFIMTPKLIKYRVPTDFTIEWVLFTLVLGYPFIRRFDKLVEEASHPPKKPAAVTPPKN